MAHYLAHSSCSVKWSFLSLALIFRKPCRGSIWTFRKTLNWACVHSRARWLYIAEVYLQSMFSGNRENGRHSCVNILVENQGLGGSGAAAGLHFQSALYEVLQEENISYHRIFQHRRSDS